MSFPASNQDRLRPAIARMRAIKDNVPKGYEVEQAWVNEFHDAIDGLERQLTMELAEFRLPSSALYRSVASSNMDGQLTYRDGLWCQRTMLLQKVDALLYYLQDLYGDRSG